MDTARHDDAIQAAMLLFWQQGYSDTSMAEIVDVTGMNRYALYSRFGNKREIFLKTLAVYFEEGRQTFQPIATDSSRPPFARIAECLQIIKTQLMSQKKGCFMCHVAIEECAEDEEISRAITNYFAQILEMIAVPLRDAQTMGLLNPNLTLEQAAQLIFDCKLSIGQLTKAGANEADIDRILSATMAALQAMPTPQTRVSSALSHMGQAQP